MNDAITVVGSLGGDPTLKSVNGDRVAEFRLACTSRRKEGEEWVNGHTNWYSVEAWGGMADHVGASLRRGDVVVLLGRLKVDQWESGDKRGTSVKIRVEHVGHSLRVGPSTRQRRASDSGGAPSGERDSADDAAALADDPALADARALSGAGATSGGDWGAQATANAFGA
ncbi:single-stranded DNA-binding protein [Agrococcus carbonis]|uniref:Single-stranded DNA-binding protein n=1 Tax=Agrococcus carbonis TaxID=684552 RepID=A0A1H1L4D2_9MICO|nr:single-stranded DNA-binding protein [Agrococcus carbonis]SDR69396.1 single-strand DNA-binding protein [Agrococcus carbonis]